jgi:outer membrane protein assembly factor BamD (BamD/ComL family)
MGQTRLQQGRYSEAESMLREALKDQEKTNPENWERDNSRSMLGAALAGQRRYSEAEPLVLSGYHGLVEREAAIPWENRSLVPQAATRIVQLYEDWGKTEQAAEWRVRLQKP